MALRLMFRLPFLSNSLYEVLLFKLFVFYYFVRCMLSGLYRAFRGLIWHVTSRVYFGSRQPWYLDHKVYKGPKMSHKPHRVQSCSRVRSAPNLWIRDYKMVRKLHLFNYPKVVRYSLTTCVSLLIYILCFFRIWTLEEHMLEGMQVRM